MKTIVFSLLALLGIQAYGHSPAPEAAANPLIELETPGGSKMLTDWMSVHITAIRNCKVPTHHNRQLAYMGVALYESVVAGDPNYRSLAGQLNGYIATPAMPVSREICWQASANSALAETFRHFYPENPVTLQRIDSMEQSCKKQLVTQGYSEASVNSGAEYGLQVAHAVIVWSNSDGDDKADAAYTVPGGPGLYEPTPPAFIPPIHPYMGNCRTFVKGSIENTIPPPPVAFSEDRQSPFYAMVDEVYRVSQQNDDEKVATALFWDDFPNGKTLTGGGHWESILKNVMSQLNLSFIEGAHVYAELFITMEDAAIGCFKAKYTYNLLRPITYINKYMHQPDWNSLIATPPHPEYPAAHATVSMAGATILTSILGDRVSFTDNTYAYRGYKPHHFNNFTEAGREAGMSRLYGGIHYLPSIEAGYKQGENIAANIGNKLVFKN